jgi:hypothetical protein
MRITVARPNLVSDGRPAPRALGSVDAGEFGKIENLPAG